MLWGSLLAFALAAPYAQALLRFPCSQLVTQRFDPLVQPGAVSAHLHQIVGGDAFNITMDPANDLPKQSTCTTCRFKEDASNYWTAVMFFKHSNGSYIRVPQMANQFTGSPNGGMTVYYIQPPDGRKVKTFPKGFRMIVGNPFYRNDSFIDPASAQAKALTFRCWNANFGSDANWPHPGTGPLDTVELPKKNCPGGIRANIFFPSCWNGKDLDPADHHSHMAFPTGTVPRDGLFFMNGDCPATHPIRMPLVFMETAWDTRPFAKMWPKDGSQPFVYSQGDPTGYGQHADYVFGWDGDSLQRAMDTCTDMGGQPEGCRALTIRSDSDINKCIQKPKVPEITEGYLAALPGCNPVQDGPKPAVPVNGCGAVSTTGAVPAPTVSPPILPSPPTVTQPPPVSTQPPSPTNPDAPMQTHYGQCGGAQWTGATTCQPPYTCKISSQYYSQCL